MEPHIAAGPRYVISILGSIIFSIEKQNRFVKFHAAQATRIAVGHLVLALHIWGIIAGFTGKMVKFPIVGAIAERMAGGPVVPLC